MATETEEALLRSRALRSRLFQKLLPATIDGASLSRNNVTPDSRNNVPIYRRGLLSSRNSVALDGRNNVAPGRYSGVAPERHRSVASRNSVALDGRHNVKPARSNRTIRGAAECLHTVPSFPSDVHYRHDIASNNIVAMCNGASSCPSCFPRHDLPWRTSHDCWETRGGLARRKKDIDFAFVWIKHELVRIKCNCTRKPKTNQKSNSLNSLSEFFL